MRRRLFLTLCLSFLVVLAAACTSAPAGTPAGGPSAATPTAEIVTATPEPTATKKPRSGPLATAAALAQQVTLIAPTAGPAADDYVGLLKMAWQLVKENYVRDNFNGVDWDAKLEEYLPRAESITDQGAFWDMMEDFIGELHDDHSRFVRPARFGVEFDIPSDEAGRPWTGIQIWPGPGREDQVLNIWYVCSSSPAASAGLVRGDRILAVNGQAIERGPDGFAREDWIPVMFGDGESDRVTLTVQRGPNASPEDITLRLGGAGGCDGWAIDLLSSEPRIGYLRIPEFPGDADVNVLDAIEALEQSQPLDGLIVDVRHNPGGNSDRSIAVFTEGTFGMVGPLRKDKTRAIYRIRGPVKWNETTPVVVLTDGSSHSAAEYFATAMQQSGRATLVGMPTAGNTEGINSWTLPDGSLIRLAWTTLELPDGSTLEGVGVIPDVKVPLGDWGLRQTPDVQVQRGLEILLGG